MQGCPSGSPNWPSFSPGRDSARKLVAQLLPGGKADLSPGVKGPGVRGRSQAPRRACQKFTRSIARQNHRRDRSREDHVTIDIKIRVGPSEICTRPDQSAGLRVEARLYHPFGMRSDDACVGYECNGRFLEIGPATPANSRSCAQSRNAD